MTSITVVPSNHTILFQPKFMYYTYIFCPNLQDTTIIHDKNHPDYSEQAEIRLRRLSVSIGSTGHHEKDMSVFSPLSDTSYAPVFSSEDEGFLSPKRKSDDRVNIWFKYPKEGILAIFYFYFFLRFSSWSVFAKWFLYSLNFIYEIKLKNTGKLEKKYCKFVSQKKWEPCNCHYASCTVQFQQETFHLLFDTLTEHCHLEMSVLMEEGSWGRGLMEDNLPTFSVRC